MALLQISLYSRYLQRTVPLNCIIPIDTTDFPSQSLPEEKPFKTLYLLSGFFGNHNDWMLAGDIALLAIKHNMCIITPAGENKFYIDQANGEAYGKFIGEELVEMTRRLLPLSRKREDTYIGGFSMGGFGSLVNGLKYHDTFSKVIALSPGVFNSAILNTSTTPDPNHAPLNPDSLAINKSFLESVFGPFDLVDGSEKDIWQLATDAQSNSPDIYIAIGTEDFLYQSVQSYRKHLEEIEAPLTYVEGPGVHNFEFWNRYLADALDNFI